MNRHLIVSTSLIVFTIIAIVVIGRMDHFTYSKRLAGATINYEKCRVLSVLKQSLKESSHSSDIQVGNQTLKVEMLTGKHKGETLTAQNHLTSYNSVVAQAGQRLIVVVDELDSGKLQVRVHNHYRAPIIYMFTLVFLLMMVGVSGKKGLLSCLNLIYTFACILLIFLPLLMRGYSPVWVAVGVVILVTSGNMIFLNGVSKKTLCAIVGTACGVIGSGLILLIFSRWAHISGFSLEETESLLFIRQKTGLGVAHLLFAGILIASMGAVMDTAMSIVSAINELYANRPDLSAINLFLSGMNVGKDMIGTMSNTLILAFAGAALPTILILNFYSVQYNQLINSNFVALEIAQALSGSMAVVLTIPLTAALSAKILKRRHVVACASEDQPHLKMSPQVTLT